jgi:hypothetical protein
MLMRLTFLVALYLALDVATPMIPGALVFSAEDSVEVHQTSRFRAHDAVSPSVPRRTGVRPIERILVTPRPALSAPRVRRAHVVRPRLPAPAPTPSAEDH